jgi:GNAT superfamily N-acetyltransferase/DNA-binding transcriptional ArsR family regulator
MRSMPAVPPPRREATAAEARALAHPLRLRIIRLLFDRSLTNHELATALGENPATVLHHVRTLLRTGFIAPEPERRGPRGNVEKPYRSTGRSWSLAIDDDPAVADVAQATLAAFTAELRDAQPNDDLSTSRLAVNLTADRRRELEARLGAVLDEYATQPQDPDGESWAIFLALHRRAPLAVGEPSRTEDAPAATVATDHVDISECPSDDNIAALLVRAQWAELSARYGEPEPAPASIRDPSAFAAPNGTFVVLRVSDEAVGCGGVCRFDGTTAELKAVYVMPAHRGRGYSRLIVETVEARAVALGYRTLRLETGDAQPEAIGLYTALGYSRIENYGEYRDLPRSVCFERELRAGPVREAM